MVAKLCIDIILALDIMHQLSEQIFKRQINFYSDLTSCQKTIQFYREHRHTEYLIYKDSYGSAMTVDNYVVENSTLPYA